MVTNWSNYSFEGLLKFIASTIYLGTQSTQSKRRREDFSSLFFVTEREKEALFALKQSHICIVIFRGACNSIFLDMKRDSIFVQCLSPGESFRSGFLGAQLFSLVLSLHKNKPQWASYGVQLNSFLCTKRGLLFVSQPWQLLVRPLKHQWAQ